jgi:mycothiol synthase
MFTHDSIHTKQATLPFERYQTRRYREEADTVKISELEQICLDHDGLDYASTPEDVERYLRKQPNFELQKDVLLVEDGDRLIGYITTYWRQQSEGERLYRHYGFVHPDYRRQGIGTALLAHAEDRGRQVARNHPAEIPKAYMLFINDLVTDRIALVTKAGYEPVRYFYSMVRPLDQPIKQVPMPEGLEVRPVTPEQYRQVFAALDEAFEDHWGHITLTDADIQEWMESPYFQPELWKVAWDGDQVAGTVLNFIDHTENKRFKRLRGYTEDICVRRPYRRRSLASSLLTQSLQRLKDLGLQEASLGVDTDNPSGALQLYQRVGFNAIKRSAAYRKTLTLDSKEYPND